MAEDAFDKSLEGKSEQELLAMIKNGGLLADQLTKVLKKWREIKNEIEESKNSVQDFTKKLQNMLKVNKESSQIFSDMVSNFSPVNQSANKLYTSFKNILNPATAFWQLTSMAVDRFKELDDAAFSFRENTGFLASQTSEIESNIRIASRDLATFGVTTESANAAAQQLANAFGDTAIANKENIEYVSLMKENLGVSVEDSTALMQNFMGIGGMSDKIARETAGAAASLSKAAGVPFKEVMKEVAKPSGEVRSLIRGSVDALIKGAIEAKRLGTSLEAVGRAAAGVLDFQNSVNDEMEASVLFGKDINLQKLRELSYAGDLKGFAKEQSRLLQQAGDVSKMDFFQRQGIAKALGMSVEEMDKMNAKQQEMNKLRAENPELYKQLTADLDTIEKTNETLTEKYQKELKSQQLANVQKKLMGDIQAIMTDISEVLLPIVKLFFAIIVPIIKIGVLITKLILAPFRVLNDIIDELNKKFEFMKTIGEFISSIFSKISNLMDTTGGQIVGTIVLIGLAWKTRLGPAMKGVFTGAIDSAKGLFTTVKNLIKKPDLSNIPGVSAPTTPAAAGTAPTVPSAGGTSTGGDLTKGIESTSKSGENIKPTAGQNIKDFLKNLSDGIKSFTPLAEILKGLLGIAASGPAFLLFIPAIPGILLMAAVGALAPLITAGFTGLSAGIKMMDITAIGKGLLGIAALGISIIPFAFAMSLFSDVNWTGVMAGAAALVVFTAAAFGLGALLASGVGAVLFAAGVAGIAALGVAMLPFAYAAKLAGEGMKDFGIGVKDIAANISELASLKDTLSVFKDQEVISGIYAMGMAIAFLNSQLEQLGVNLPALGEVNKIKGEQGRNDEVVGKLDELIQLMRNGGIAVNIDGSKVSTAVGVATKFRGAF